MHNNIPTGYIPVSGYPGYYMNEDRTSFIHYKSGSAPMAEREGRLCVDLYLRGEWTWVPVDDIKMSRMERIRQTRSRKTQRVDDLSGYREVPSIPNIYINEGLVPVDGTTGWELSAVKVNRKGEAQYLIRNAGKEFVRTGQELYTKAYKEG